MEKKYQRYTMSEIAEACNVSRITVHRVINGSPNVSDETREKVESFINKVNFITNKNAVTLSRKKSNTIALILHNVSTEFSSIVYDSIFQICAKKDYYLYLASSNNDPNREQKNIRTFIELGVDGIIIFSVSKNSEGLRLAVNNGIPVVQLLSTDDSIESVNVLIDQIAVSEEMTDFLIGKGHKNIVYVNGNYGSFLLSRKRESLYNMSIHHDRFNGYARAMAAAGIGNNLLKLEFYQELYSNEEHTFDELREVMQTRCPSAIMCYDDYTALCVMSELKKWGYRIPEDVSVVGHDNIDMLKFVSPRLTTVDTSIKSLAQMCAEELFEQLSNGIAAKKVMAGARIIEGDSVKQIAP